MIDGSDAHRANGTDATEDVEKIVQLFDSATARMKELPKDSNCPLNDKCPKISNLWIQILIVSFVNHGSLVKCGLKLSTTGPCQIRQGY
jgi:hypothetical protein